MTAPTDRLAAVKAAEARAKAAYEADIAALKQEIIDREAKDVSNLSPNFVIALSAIAVVVGFVLGLVLRLSGG